MAILRNDTTVRSADGQSTSPIITAANIGNYGISTTSTYYIGTTQNVFNRASGAQTLTGVSIDGNAANITAYTINQNVGTGNAPSFTGMTSTAMLVASTSMSSNDDWQNSPISIRERGLVGNAQSANTYSPNLNFHWASRISNSLWMDANGNLAWGSYDGSGVPSSDGAFYANNLYASIYFDKNNTVYYLDPANSGTSLLVAGSIAAGLTTPLHKIQATGLISASDATYNNDSTFIGAILNNDGTNPGLDLRRWNGGGAGTNNHGATYIATNSVGDTIFYNGLIAANTRATNEKMRIAVNGNVGIGTTSPTYKLDVSGTARIANDMLATGNITIAKSAAYLILDGTNSDAEIYWRANSSNRWAAGMNVGDATENFNIYNYTTATTNFTILKASGNVGIGSTNPSQKLHVVGTGFASTDFRAPIFYDSDNTTYYLDPNASTSGNLFGVLKQNDGKFVRDSYFRTISGTGDYYASGASGWYTVASITLTTNCTGGVLYGTLYDHRYDGADAYQISIVARAECDFQTNNESHYVNVGCTILGSTNITNYQSKIRVLLVASSANSRTYEVQFLETAWNRDTWQLETSGSPVWTIYSTAQAPGTSTGTARVFYISNNNADNIRANTASYSPVYYDSSDTSYYSDPAGLNRFNALNIGNQGALTGNTTYALGAYHNSRYMVGLRYSSGGAAYPWLVHDSWNGSAFIIHFNGVGDKFNFSESGIGQASGDFRAPIFYDSADTTYYLDPANTGTSLIVAGKIGSGVTSPAYELDFGLLNETTSTDTIRFNSYNGPAGGGSGVGAATGGGSTIGGGITWKSNYSGYTKRSAGIMQIGEGNYFRAGLAFYTNNVTDQTTDWTEAMRISSNSYIGIGTTSPDTNLQIVGHVHVGNQTTFDNTGGWNKTIYLDGTVHARMRIIGSAFASGKNSQTETNIWVDNSVAPYSGLTTNAGSFTINAGFTTLTNSARSPIFYDSDNTSYYLDPASTSNLNIVNLVGITGAGNAYIQTISTGTSYTSHFQIREASGGGGNTSETYAPALGFHWSGVVASNILMEASGRIAIRNNPGSGYENFIAAILYAGSSVQAPIFYDSNDTTYYVDPASFSLISSLGIGGLTSSSNVQMYDSYVDASSSYLQSPPLIIRKDNSATGAIDQAPVGLFIYNLNGTNNTWTKLSMGSREAAGAGNTVSIAGLAAQKTAGTANAWATGNLHFWTKAGATQITNMVAYSSGYVQSDYSFRSPIFYDSNDTNYYIDPASTSRVSTLYVANVLADSASLNGRILLYGNLHIDAYGANDIYCNYYSGRRFRTYKGAGTGVETFRADTDGIVYAFQDFRAPIFYDYNDTTYYVDPASTSIMQYVRATNFYDGTGTYNVNLGSGNSEGRGLVAGYSGGSYGGIGYNVRHTTTGGSWIAPSTDTSTYLLFSNGIYFYYAAGGAAGRTLSYSTIGSLTSAGIFTVSGDVRAPIFYDSNNTAYYIDAASTSVLNTATISTVQTNAIAKQTNGSPITINSGLNAALGLRVYYDMNLYNTLVFTDSAWNSQGRIFGSSSVVTIQAATTTTSFVKYAGYSEEGGSFRAPIFYDSDNTSYYIDAASTSSLNILNLAGYVDVGTYIYLRNNLRMLNSAGSGWLETIVRNSGSPYFQNSIDGGTFLASDVSENNNWLFQENVRGWGIFYFNRGTQSGQTFGSYTTIGAETFIIGQGTGTTMTSTWTGYNASSKVAIMLSNYSGYIWANDTIFSATGMRAPIFYDSDNTSFYIDGAGTSRLQNLNVNEYYAIGWFRSSSSGNGLYNESTGQHFYSDDNLYWNVASSGTAQGIRLRTGGYNGTVRGYFYANNSNDVGFLNSGGNWRARIVGGDYFLADGSSIRGQIFYDSNDTNYYCDPNSSSVLASVNARAYYPVSDVTESDIYARSIAICAYHHGDSLTYDTFQFNAASVYETKATSGSSFVSSTVDTSIFKGDRFGGMTIANNTYQARWTWNNTIGYKFLKSLYIANSTNGNSFTVTIEASGNGTTWTTIATSTAMSNWPGHSWYNYAWNNNAYQGYIRITVTPSWSTAYDINIYNMRYFCSYNLDAGSRLYDWDYSKNVTFAAVVDANQFRDSSNTAYYCDPASTSNLVGLTVANTISGSISGNAATVTNGVYLTGTQNITGIKRFQSDLGTTSGSITDPPLQVFANGTNAAFMSFHRGGSFAVNMGLDSDNVLRIGGWSASANRLQLDMSGNLTLAGVVDATQFRDSSNTAYYIDPASTSNLLGLTVTNTITGSVSGSSGSCTGNAANVTGTVAIANGGTGATTAAAAATNLGLGTGNTPKFLNVFGEKAAVTSSASTTVNTQYNVTELTLSASVTTLTLSNIQASPIVHMWTIVTLGQGTAYSITWPAAVKWPGGTAPTLTSTLNKRDIYQFVTYDGGTTIYAIIVGQNL